MPATPDERAQAGEQLAEIERLDQIVVSAAIEPLDSRLDGVAGGQHQDGNRASRGADGAAHRESILHRKHDVEDQGVVVDRFDLEHGALPVGRQIDRVGLLAQSLGEHVSRGGFVFDQQDAHDSGPLEDSRRSRRALR